MKALAFCLLPFYAVLFSAALPAKETNPSSLPPTQADISYKTGDNLTACEKERCKLDLHLPARKKDFPTLVWFRGSGLTGGSKDDPKTDAMSL